MTDSTVEAVARALRNHEDSYYDRVQGLHYFSERAVKAALAALPSPEREPRWFQDEEMRRHSDELREPMREALEEIYEVREKLVALRRMVEAAGQPFYEEILNEVIPVLARAHDAALAPPTAQSGDRT